MSTDNCEIPQWKKELIARLRNRTARAGPPVQQPSEASVGSSVQRCEVVAGGTNMVQDRSWEQSPDSEEELRYGPGIVNKLKNKYLSLAQRESSRASILPMRKAASLENILDGEDAAPERAFRPRAAAKAAPSRYARAPRSDLKRARSVETISRTEDEIDQAPRTKQRESFHEEMLIKEGSGDKKMSENPPPQVQQENNKFHRVVNRPKRIAPIMNEKEKPPADVVKQAKLIFERRPEQRTKAPQQTGDVAAKVATYKSIIVQAKAAKKPPIKVKPVALGDAKKTNGIRPQAKGKPIQEKTQENGDEGTKTPPSLPSPIPDVSRIEVKPSSNENGLTKSTSLSETPDLIMTSSPLASINSPSFRISATENFIREERRNSVPSFDKPPSADEPQKDKEFDEIDHENDDEEGVKKLGNRQLDLSNGTNTVTFNFAKSTKPANHLPLVNRNVSNTQTSVLQPLKLEINGVGGVEKRISPNHHHHVVEVIRSSTPISSSSSASSSPKPSLTILEIEKNLINVAKTLEQPPPPPPPAVNKNSGTNNIASGNNSSVSIKSVEEVTKIKVPKVRKPPRELENNSIVFKFTDRKEVPDYVHNDGVRRVAKIEKPKVGEGGIILLPGASIDESFTDEDEEVMRSLECPPSPCDVTFINDNVLIDGKSSLSQKTKKAKMKISFVEAGPEIYEYPSESSLLIEDVPTSPMTAQIRHSVTSLSGSSSLGNYTPKSTEEFHPGVTRSVQQNIPTTKSGDNIESTDSEKNELILQEVEKPILFSAGANSDILF